MPHARFMGEAIVCARRTAAVITKRNDGRQTTEEAIHRDLNHENRSCGIATLFLFVLSFYGESLGGRIFVTVLSTVA